MPEAAWAPQHLLFPGARASLSPAHSCVAPSPGACHSRSFVKNGFGNKCPSHCQGPFLPWGHRHPCLMEKAHRSWHPPSFSHENMRQFLNLPEAPLTHL